MIFRKYRILIVIAFISIFSSKMIISAAPVFIAYFDKSTMNAVISQLEQEHSSEDDAAKNLLKFAEFKIIDFHYSYTYVPLLPSVGIKNSFVDHFKRYVDPYHPSVPTPPPNFI